MIVVGPFSITTCMKRTPNPCFLSSLSLPVRRHTQNTAKPAPALAPHSSPNPTFLYCATQHQHQHRHSQHHYQQGFRMHFSCSSLSPDSPPEAGQHRSELPVSRPALRRVKCCKDLRKRARRISLHTGISPQTGVHPDPTYIAPVIEVAVPIVYAKIISVNNTPTSESFPRLKRESRRIEDYVLPVDISSEPESPTTGRESETATPTSVPSAQKQVGARLQRKRATIFEPGELSAAYLAW